jgi:hypothetical protein
VTTTDDQTARCEALSERLFDALVDTMELASVYAGLRLGLYQALRDGAPATAAERAGIDERYAREWLEQQAVAGLLEVEGGGDQKARAYRLPAAHAEVLLDPDSPCTRAGRRCGWAAWRASCTASRRPTAPAGACLPRLRRRLPPRHRPHEPADVRQRPGGLVPGRPRAARPPAGPRAPGCSTSAAAPAGRASRWPAPTRGCGWTASTATTPRSPRPAATPPRPASATGSLRGGRRRHRGRTRRRLRRGVRLRGAARHGAAGRGAPGGPRPARRRRRPGGRRREVAEEFTAPGDEIERLNYGFSWWHCLPASRVETPSAAAGTALRPATVRGWAEQAGFAGVQVMPVDHAFWRFYRLQG